MDTPILVTGGTGTLGRLVVARLREQGRAVRVLSRHAGEAAAGVQYAVADLTTGEGVDAAVRGVEVIVHCAGSTKGDGEKARQLVEAAARAGVRHVVHISVVGADRVPVVGRTDRAMFAYFESKLAAERAISAAGVPWTILRATQFHELMLMTASGMAKLPVVPVPSGFHIQPVAADEVADRLVALALGEPAGLVPDMAGPQVIPMRDLVRGYLRAAGKHRALVPLHLPGRGARAFRAGANLAPDHAVGQQTWESFLAGAR